MFRQTHFSLSARTASFPVQDGSDIFLLEILQRRSKKRHGNVESGRTLHRSMGPAPSKAEFSSRRERLPDSPEAKPQEIVGPCPQGVEIQTVSESATQVLSTVRRCATALSKITPSRRNAIIPFAEIHSSNRHK